MYQIAANMTQKMRNTDLLGKQMAYGQSANLGSPQAKDAGSGIERKKTGRRDERKKILHR